MASSHGRPHGDNEVKSVRPNEVKSKRRSDLSAERGASERHDVQSERRRVHGGPQTNRYGENDSTRSGRGKR